jgi:hypothetical protein
MPCIEMLEVAYLYGYFIVSIWAHIPEYDIIIVHFVVTNRLTTTPTTLKYEHIVDDGNTVSVCAPSESVGFKITNILLE